MIAAVPLEQRTRVARENIRHQAMHARLRELEDEAQLLRQENERLRAEVGSDPLTRLANRRRFEQEFQIAYRCAFRYRGALSVLMVDVDGMKRLNDTHGHPAGDRALCIVAAHLRDAVRGSDLVARLGGDEFAVILPATGKTGAVQVAERIRGTVHAGGWPPSTPLTVSIGVATLDGGSADYTQSAEMLACADRSLYAAKRAGKNRVETGAPHILSVD